MKSEVAGGHEDVKPGTGNTVDGIAMTVHGARWAPERLGRTPGIKYTIV